MVAQPFVMELIPGFGRKELTGTYFGIFYAVSGIAAAVGNAAVGRAMDAAPGGEAAPPPCSPGPAAWRPDSSRRAR